MQITSNIFKKNLINGTILFLILENFRPVFSGFTTPKLMKLLKNNDYLRLILLYFIIYFFLDELFEESNDSSNLVISLMILIFIVIFTRQPLNFNIFQSLLLFTIYILSELNVNFNTIYIFYGIIAASLLGGLYIYYLKQLRDKKSNFSYVKFLIGNREVDYNTK